MKKLVITLCFAIAMISIIGCSKKNNSKENNIEEVKSDIQNLFSDRKEIDYVMTTRVDTQYTVNTENQIDELMKYLQEIEYSEFDTSLEEKVTPEPIATGSRTDGINLVFHYKNGSRRALALYSTEEREFVEYTEISEKPYTEETSIYTTMEEEWNDILLIMRKGNEKDLNEK